MEPGRNPMIILFTTRIHCRTHRPLERSGAFDFRVMSYERLFRARSLPRATFIFSDLDRLHFWDLECAGRIYRQLGELGARVLNDPGRFRSRFQLLRRLHARGFNDFNVWPVDETPPPSAYPVFLRTDSAHRGPLTDLLTSPEELRVAIDAQIARAVPVRELMIVQYAAEPVREDLYRKLAVYRVGGRMVPALCAHQGHWKAKFGESGIAGGQLYDDEYRLVSENAFGEVIRPAFDLGAIEYGRADFGLFQGRPQVYEINTNPMIRNLKTHPFPVRLRASEAAMSALVDAFSHIDGPASGSRCRLADHRSIRERLRDLYCSGRWRRVPESP
jgi:hypothetical protein